jgi:ankyrin repeat protein
MERWSIALCTVAERGRLEAARLLMEGGADPGRARGDGVTPLMQAAQTGQLDAAVAAGARRGGRRRAPP